jgi:methylmalonyl-CoA mutase, N-terminal domain
MRDRFGASNLRAQQLRFHTQTAGSTLTAQQPDNNIVRVALQALAAVLGGTQSLHCNGRDEALALPTEVSAAIALRTQQIIAFESGVPNTVDPVGGSQAVEALTDRIEREASAILERIDRLGGTLAAIEAGVIQRDIQDAAYIAQQRIDTGETVVVGVNQFTDQSVDLQPRIETLTIDPEIETRQVERLQRVRASRDHAAWRASLDAVIAAARGGDNLVPLILHAVEAHATVGEISDAMRSVFGEHKEINA